jgi:hypothetical protein
MVLGEVGSERAALDVAPHGTEPMISCVFCQTAFAQVDSVYVSHVLAGHPIESALAAVAIAGVPALAKGNIRVAVGLYFALALAATGMARRATGEGGT